MTDFPKPPSQLSALQRDLLEAFFAREQRFYLTGGAALAGYHLGHRAVGGFELFAPANAHLSDASRALKDASTEAGAVLRMLKRHPEVAKYEVHKGAERCGIVLAIDTAKVLESTKLVFGKVRVDTLREIAANTVCAILARSEASDLEDLMALASHGLDFDEALADAAVKKPGIDASALAAALDKRVLGSTGDLEALDGFRVELVNRLRGNG
jgi:hypothetical protein